VKRTEDTASAHHVAGDKNPQHYMTINNKDYVAQYILKLEEGSLFWKKLPRHT
jgi:hypothetical protein